MTTDACATPGCGHAGLYHDDEGCRVQLAGPVPAMLCPCTAYLPPRPVPEEEAPTSNTRRCAYCKDPMVLGKRVCRCGSSAWEWIDPTMTDERMKAAVIENATASASVPAPHAEAEVLEAGDITPEEGEAWNAYWATRDKWMHHSDVMPELRAFIAGRRSLRGRGDRGC